MFNFTYQGHSEALPVVVEGNKTTEYTVGSTVTIYTPIDEYTIGGQKMVLWGEAPYLFYVWVSGFMGMQQIVLNERFTTGGNEKLVVTTSSYYDSGYLSEYSVVLSKSVFVGSTGSTTKTTVDSIAALSSSATSSGGHIAFTDANTNGELDSGDYFIISMGTTNSKYVWDIYEVTLKRGNSNETSKSLFLGYKGFLYAESYYEPTGYGITPVMTITLSTRPDGNYTITIIAVSQSLFMSDVKWYIIDANGVARASGYLVANANSTMSDTICIYTADNNMDGKLSAGDCLLFWDTGTKTIQSGWKFSLIYQPTGGAMAQITFF
jgi:hypothetical protein